MWLAKKLDGVSRPQLVSAIFGGLIAFAACVLYALDVAKYPNLSHFPSNPPLGGDFYQFWAAAKLTLAHLSEGAYMPDLFTAALRDVVDFNPRAFFSPLYYPPYYLLLIAPLGLLPFFSALLVFWGVGLGVFLSGLWLWARRTSTLFFMLCFTGIWVNLLTGQNGLLTAGFFAIATFAVTLNPYIAGLFFGLLTIKPHLGLLIPVALIAGGHWRVVKYTALTWFLLVGASLSLFGIVTWLYGVPAMLSASTTLGSSMDLLMRIPSLYSFSRLSAFDSFLLSYFPSLPLTPHGVSLLLQMGCLVVASWCVARLWRQSSNTRLKAAGLAAGTLFASPFLYDYDTALLALPLLLLALEATERGWRWPERIILPLGFLWPMLINKFPSLLHMQIGFIMPLLVLWLVMRRFKREQLARQADSGVNTPL